MAETVSKAEFDALKAELAALRSISGQGDELARARAAEVAQKMGKVAALKAKAIELSGEPKPAVLKYVVGEVMHYRKGVQFHRGDIIALPNDDKPENQPSFTWSAFDAKAARAPDPVAVAEQKALSQLAKEQAPKATGPLGKKAARPSDTEV